MNDKTVKHPHCLYGKCFNGMDRRSHQTHSHKLKFKPKTLILFHSINAERGKDATEQKFEENRGWFIRLMERRHFPAQKCNVQQQVLI